MVGGHEVNKDIKVILAIEIQLQLLPFPQLRGSI